MQDGTTSAVCEAAQSRALVPLASAESARGPSASRPLAPFMTQLFACAERLEGFGRLRRAGPERASASYLGSDQLEVAALPRFERML